MLLSLYQIFGSKFFLTVRVGVCELCGKKRGNFSQFLFHHRPFLRIDWHAQNAAESTSFSPTFHSTQRDDKPFNRAFESEPIERTDDDVMQWRPDSTVISSNPTQTETNGKL